MIALVVAALLSGGAVLLAAPLPDRPSSQRWTRWLVPGVAAAAVVAVLGSLVLPAVVLGVAGFGALAVRRRTAAATRAAATADAVRESCEALAGELVAGTTPARALEVAVEVWPPLGAAARAEQVGGSVPDSLREVARSHRGAADLQQIAAAWQLSHRSGAALGDALSAVAADLADQRATRALVRSELASARSTARLIAVLPVMTLAMSSGTGDPVGFLLGTGPGLVCLAAGLAMALAGLAWIERIAAGVEQAI